MKYLRLTNSTEGKVLCEHCAVADNIFTRTRGLMGRCALAPGEGLLITHCPSIHMYWMKFSLDVVFVTRENVVTDFVENIAPGKIYVAKQQCGKPYAAIELPVGTIAQSRTQLGDKLICEETAAPV